MVDFLSLQKSLGFGVGTGTSSPLNTFLDSATLAASNTWAQPQWISTTTTQADLGGFLMSDPQGFQKITTLPSGQIMSTPGMNHLGTIKDFRKKFKQYSKEEFRKMGSKPVVKEILLGMTKLNKEEIQNRIAQHLNA